jgi:hypothetical protein
LISGIDFIQKEIFHSHIYINFYFYLKVILTENIWEES